MYTWPSCFGGFSVVGGVGGNKRLKEGTAEHIRLRKLIFSSFFRFFFVPQVFSITLNHSPHLSQEHLRVLKDFSNTAKPHFPSPKPPTSASRRLPQPVRIRLKRPQCRGRPAVGRQPFEAREAVIPKMGFLRSRAFWRKGQKK